MRVSAAGNMPLQGLVKPPAKPVVMINVQKKSALSRSAAFLSCHFYARQKGKTMFDRKNDVARNKKRADAIVYAGAADEVVLTQSDFESEEEFRRWKAWSDADYKQTEKAMRRDYDHVIYGLEGWKIPASERMEKQEEIINEDKLKSVLTERQYKRLHLYAVMNMTLEQIADMEHVSIQSVSRSIHAAKKKILKFLSKQGEKVPF